MTRFAALLAPVCLVACRSMPHLPPMLEHSAKVHVDYSGRIAPESWLSLAPPAEMDGEPAGSDPVTYDCTLWLVDRRAVEGVFALPANGPTAAIFDYADASARLDELASLGLAKQVNASALGARGGRRATMLVVSQTAYVKGFALQGNANAMIADPHVDVANDGVRLELEPDEDAATLRAELTMSRLQAPILVYDVGSRNRQTVSLQIPVFVNDRVRFETPLASGSAAIVSGITYTGADQVLVSVLGRPAATGATGSD